MTVVAENNCSVRAQTPVQKPLQNGVQIVEHWHCNQLPRAVTVIVIAHDRCEGRAAPGAWFACLKCEPTQHTQPSWLRENERKYENYTLNTGCVRVCAQLHRACVQLQVSRDPHSISKTRLVLLLVFCSLGVRLFAQPRTLLGRNLCPTNDDLTLHGRMFAATAMFVSQILPWLQALFHHELCAALCVRT